MGLTVGHVPDGDRVDGGRAGDAEADRGRPAGLHRSLDDVELRPVVMRGLEQSAHGATGP